MATLTRDCKFTSPIQITISDIIQVKVRSRNYSAGCERSEFYIFYEFAVPKSSGGELFLNPVEEFEMTTHL